MGAGPSEAVRLGGGRRTKNLQGEREKRKKRTKERERERERERGEKEERERRKRKESERESKRACVVGVNTSFKLLQNCKRHGKRGGGRKPREKTQGKRCKKRQKWPEKIQ